MTHKQVRPPYRCFVTSAAGMPPLDYNSFWPICDVLSFLQTVQIPVSCVPAHDHVIPTIGMGWGDTTITSSTAGMALCSACRGRQILVCSGQAAVVRCVTFGLSKVH